MKLTVKIGDLIQAATDVAATLDRSGSAAGKVYLKAVKKKDGGPDTLYMFSTNIRSETLNKTEATVEEGGHILVSSDHLIGGLTGRPKEDMVELSAENENPKRMKIKYGKSAVHAAADSDVTVIAAAVLALPLDTDPSCTVNAKDLESFIHCSSFCILNDNTGQNNVLGSLNIFDTPTTLEAQATDNSIAVHMLIKAAEKTGTLGNVKLPLACLASLNRLLSRRQKETVQIIKQGDNRLYFRFGDTFYGTALMAGKYPDIKTICNSTPSTYKITATREQIKPALVRCSVFRNKKGTIDMELKKEELVLRVSSDDDNGDIKDFVPVASAQGKWPESEAKISMGMDYLANVIGVSPSEEVEIGMTSALKPMVIVNKDEGMESTYVLMGVVGKKG